MTSPRSIRALVIVAVVAAGIERIDLFGGRGATVTPFLALTPFLVVAALRNRRAPSAVYSPRAKLGTAAVTVFALAAIASLTASDSSLSPQRVVLLLLLIAGSWSLVTLAAEPAGAAALRQGAVIGLVAFAGFDLLQWGVFQTYGASAPPFSDFLNLEVSQYGAERVRLTGGLLDGNRAAVVLATYAYLIVADPRVSRTGSAAFGLAILCGSTFLLILTLSRSGLVVFALVLLGAAFQLASRMSRVQWGFMHVLVATVVGWLVASSALTNFTALSTLQGRLTLDGSALTHFSLYERAGELLDQQPGIYLTGTGYGSSYLYLQDIFPSVYGNFHSLYVSTLIEMGVIGLAAACLLVTAPLVTRRFWLCLGVLVFGIFYQAVSDPIFWIQIAIMWLLPDTKPDSVAPPSAVNKSGGAASSKVKAESPCPPSIA